MIDAGTDADRLASLVAVWWEAVDSFTRVLEHVDEDQWTTPTDLPGWDVHAVAAHTAHLESLLAGRRHEEVDIGAELGSGFWQVADGSVAALAGTLRLAASDIVNGTAPVPDPSIRERFRQSSRTAAMVGVYDRVRG